MPRARPGRSVASGLCVVLALALVSGCSGGAEPEPSADPSSVTAEPTSTRGAAPTRVRMGHVLGRLPAARREALRGQIVEVVDAWWEASFLGGDYPRSSFPSAFPGFTKGAEARARRDKHLMSNRELGPRIDSVVAVRRRVTLDVVSVDRRPRSVTARFVLAFETTGEEAGTTTVRGRLFLTRPQGQWQVFGYDVSRAVES